MSRNRKKTVKIETNNEELIKQVFELYKPNKVQLFIMKKVRLNAPMTGNKNRVKQLMNVLNLSKEIVEVLERRLYVI